MPGVPSQYSSVRVQSPPLCPRGDRRGQRLQCGAGERPDDCAACNLPPIRTGLPVDHHHVGLIERTGVAEGEHLIADPAVIDDGAAAQRAVADQHRDPVDLVVDDLVEVEDLERIGEGHVICGISEH